MASGILSLYVAETKVRDGTIMTQPSQFAIAGKGLSVGRDSGEPVTDDYPDTAPWAFTGRTIKRVEVDVSGDADINLGSEAVAMMARE